MWSADSRNMDAANILKPAPGRGAIPLIVATTGKEYRQTIEKRGALEWWFQPCAGFRSPEM